MAQWEKQVEGPAKAIKRQEQIDTEMARLVEQHTLQPKHPEPREKKLKEAMASNANIKQILVL